MHVYIYIIIRRYLQLFSLYIHEQTCTFAVEILTVGRLE